MKKTLLTIALAVLFFSLTFFGTARAQSTVCTRTGLTGAAEQENLLYCTSNAAVLAVAGSAPVTMIDGASSTYNAAIDLAQAKNIVVGTPWLVTETVDWHGVQKTYVEFSSGLHAEHYNPSNGHVQIYTYTGEVLWSE